jgi:hypothetical protein
VSRLARGAVLIAVLIAAPACVMARYSEGQTITEDKIPQIIPGQTTKAEILEWFGAPQSYADATFLEEYLSERELVPGPVVDLPFADVLVYRFTQGRLRGLIMILYNQFRLDVASDSLVVYFDPQDRVLYYGWRKGTDVLP